MSLSNAFWDASSLNPLCVREATSIACKELTTQFGLVVWWATCVEIQSAINRVHRSGILSASDTEEATNRLNLLKTRWREVAPVDDVRKLARMLLKSHPLRAADSLQLAAALTWCRKQPKGRTFICSDIRLCEAATAAGFAVVRPGATS